MKVDSPLTSIWHRPRSRPTVRLIKQTDQEIADCGGRPTVCHYCDRPYRHAVCGCSHVHPEICRVVLCRIHADWIAGKPYCPRHAKERRR